MYNQNMFIRTDLLEHATRVNLVLTRTDQRRKIYISVDFHMLLLLRVEAG
jgi:hypothetical protein